MPSAIELFSGCGGLSTGLIAAGFEVLSAVEINQTAADTYGLNHPTVNLIVDDVRNVTAVSLLRRHNLRIGELDLLAGCSPCQGFSRLRKGESGSTDPRNQLVLEFLRLVRGLRPKTVFMENVPGLITTEYGEKLFKEILAELTRLGYTVDYRVVDTADYGVPQFRKRFVLLGSRYKRHPIELPEVTHASPEVSVRQNKLAWNTVRTAFAGIPELQNGGTDPNIPLHTCSHIGELNMRRVRTVPHDGGSRSSFPPDLVLKCHRDYPYVLVRKIGNRFFRIISDTNITPVELIYQKICSEGYTSEQELFQDIFDLYGNISIFSFNKGNDSTLPK